LLEKLETGMAKHTEDSYTDFYFERNLPEQLSAEGPRIASADINGDNLVDWYIGGAKGQPGQMYIQTSKGFEKKDQPLFKEFADFEDVAAVFFDADRDGDTDLFIGAGGNNARPGSRELQHRLYKNDGKGNFTIDTKAFPNNDMNISVAVACDYDEDGYQDLFVGSRSVPYNYGITPPAYLYHNNGSGHFKDVTRELCPQLLGAGMLTGAVWADIAGDTKKELIITGQWMPTRVFSFDGTIGKFKESINTGLNDLYGWWQTISATDLNGDGKMDLVIGNIGENFYLRPNKENPVKLWLNDFDRTGTTESFLTRTVNDKDVPVFLKREITDQFPALKKNNLKHSEYAVKSIHELFSKELVEKAEQRQFNYCASIVAINNGNGSFSFKPLPMMVQLSSVNAIEVIDINRDKKPDLVAGGNKFSFPPQFGRLDASCGHVLLNLGGGNFDYVEAKRSGLNLKGAIRDIREIKIKDKQYVLLVQNDDWPALYKIK
jgi:enediyne biosynthesis protein E4